MLPHWCICQNGSWHVSLFLCAALPGYDHKGTAATPRATLHSNAPPPKPQVLKRSVVQGCCWDRLGGGPLRLSTAVPRRRSLSIRFRPKGCWREWVRIWMEFHPGLWGKIPFQWWHWPIEKAGLHQWRLHIHIVSASLAQLTYQGRLVGHWYEEPLHHQPAATPRNPHPPAWQIQLDSTQPV